MAQKLKDSFIKNVPAPKSGRVTHWDNEVTGFGAIIYAPTKRRPNGKRSFFLNYGADGTERRVTIGEFPEFSVKAAREKAKKLRSEIAAGADPPRAQ